MKTYEIDTKDLQGFIPKGATTVKVVIKEEMLKKIYNLLENEIKEYEDLINSGNKDIFIRISTLKILSKRLKEKFKE